MSVFTPKVEQTLRSLLTGESDAYDLARKIKNTAFEKPLRILVVELPQKGAVVVLRPQTHPHAEATLSEFTEYVASQKKFPPRDCWILNPADKTITCTNDR